MIPTFSLLAALSAGVAEASPLDSEHFSLALPLEANMVGLSFGLHPELLWRPLDPQGAFHVRAATGLLMGPELSHVPVSLGLRQVFFPTRAVRPGMGLGLQAQNFFPKGHAPVTRIDQYYELTLDVRVSEGWRVGVELSPEFGWVGGFGLGMATRIGVQADFPVKK